MSGYYLKCYHPRTHMYCILQLAYHYGQCFFYSFFTAVISTSIFSYTILFHLFISTYVVKLMQEQFCNLFLYINQLKSTVYWRVKLWPWLYECWTLISGHSLNNFFCPMPPHVFVGFVVLPSGHGSNVTDFWGWDAHEAQLRCPDDVSGDMGGCSAIRALKPKFY